MEYALIGDLHSHTKRTQQVLQHIKDTAPDAKIIGLGDLFECTIGKKKAQDARNLPVEKAAVISKKFTELLTFPSIIGNQEERIALVTGEQQFLQYEEKIMIEGATLMHGHQFEWNEHFEPTFPSQETPLLFFGHSHRAAIYVDGQRTQIPYDVPLQLNDKPYQINVGAVVENKEWCLYDSEKMIVTFLKAK